MTTFKITYFYWIIALVGVVNQGHAFVTVGQTLDCDYDNILDAYLSADPFVRVTSEATFNDSFIISKAKWITGGYDNCAAAESGTLGVNKSKWRRFNDGTVVNINGNQAAVSVVVLTNFEIFGGENNIDNQPGGVSIAGNSSVIIANSELYDNEGELGGAIKITGNQASLTLNDVIIRDNHASVHGGGIYCQSQAKVNILGNSSIKNNTANASGGGVFAQSACAVVSKSGDVEPALQAQLGIVSNEAWQGGGVFLRSGATMKLTGNNQHPASVVFNKSLTDIDEGGGGLYLTDLGTRLDAINARIELNVAKYIGGGLGVYDQAVVTMRRANEPCWDNDKCSVLANNYVTDADGSGGAMDMYIGAVVNIAQTQINGNRANRSAIFNVISASYLRLEGNILSGNQHWTDDTHTELFNISGGFGDGSSIDFFYNTLVNNQANEVFSLAELPQHTLNIHNAIINHNGLTLNENGNSNNLIGTDCVFLSERASLTGNVGTVLLTDPDFVDRVNGNYHLSASSDAIDFCDQELFIGAGYNDLNGQERGFDDPSVNNYLGPYDAGAYEFNHDVIFTNGFD